MLTSMRSTWFTLGLLVVTAGADPQPSFEWGFLSSTSTSLPECERLQLFINTSAGTTSPKPPYTLIAYEAGGIPTVQAVGSDPSALWWRVDHASQSQLVLSMTDSVGNGGGVAPNLYTVVSSSSGTACHSKNPTSSVTLITNSTKSLQSCDVLPLKISGGTKPYTITIVPLSAPSAINTTLGSQFDTLDWVNRASPNVKLIAAVSDAQGTYAGSTNLISTFGSEDLTCGNQQSVQIDSTGHSLPSNETSLSSDSSSHKSNSTAAIIGSVAGSAVLIGAALLGIYFCMKRRSHRATKYAAVSPDNGFGLGGARVPVLGDDPSAAEITPFAVKEGPGTPYMDDPMYRSSADSRVTSELSFRPEMQGRASSYYTPSNISPRASSFAMQQRSSFSPPTSNWASSYDPYGREPMTPSSPLESTGTYIPEPSHGAAYAAYAAGSVMGSEARADEAGSSSGLAVSHLGVQDRGDEKQGTGPSRESVYQHEDITDVVELPPAYRERTGV